MEPMDSYKPNYTFTNIELGKVVLKPFCSLEVLHTYTNAVGMRKGMPVYMMYMLLPDVVWEEKEHTPVLIKAPVAFRATFEVGGKHKSRHQLVLCVRDNAG